MSQIDFGAAFIVATQPPTGLAGDVARGHLDIPQLLNVDDTEVTRFAPANFRVVGNSEVTPAMRGVRP